MISASSVTTSASSALIARERQPFSAQCPQSMALAEQARNGLAHAPPRVRIGQPYLH